MAQQRFLMIAFQFLKVSLQVEQFKCVDGSYPEPSSTSSSPRLEGLVPELGCLAIYGILGGGN